MSKIKHKKYKVPAEKKTLLSNFFSLSAIQGINMLLPLITLPYLVRVLGVENFGLVNFALSIIMYFNVLVSFGFELSATREVSIHRDDKKRISEIFSTVMVLKSGLLVFSFLILLSLVSFVETFKQDALLYYATFGVVFGNMIFPSWFFQGMERMKYITYVTVISKTIFTLLIFIVIKESTDYIYVPVLSSLGTIIGGLYAFRLVFKMFSVNFVLPKRKDALNHLKDSFQFFLSRVANNGSRYFATTIIGLYFGNLIVGYYAIVEKVFYAFMTLGSVVSQTIYPYMSRTKNIQFFKKVLLGVTIVSIVLLIPVVYFNEEILFFVFDERNETLSTIFVIVFSGVVFAIVSAIIGYPLLAAFGYIKYANISLIYASIIYVLYTLITVILTNNIYFVVSAIPIYMLVGLIIRIFYIRKTKLLSRQEKELIE